MGALSGSTATWHFLSKSFWFKYPSGTLLKLDSSNDVYIIQNGLKALVPQFVAQVRGLSGHKPLTPDEGMLFVFPKAGNYGFWMKDMTFPLDIIWFDQNFHVTHIEKALSPDTYPKTFYPNANSEYVLEVNAGQAATVDLKIGDTATFIKK